MMVSDRIRAEVTTGGRSVFTLQDEYSLEVELFGKDRTGTNKMHIDVNFETALNAIVFHLTVPETWNGRLNDYLITNMVLQKLAGDMRKKRNVCCPLCGHWLR